MNFRQSPSQPLILPLLFALSLQTLPMHGEFPAPYNSETESGLPPTPEQALAALKLPEGFHASLFAAEPQVQNPVGMTWDSRGRMWVAENYTYAERAKRFDLALRDRLIILEDTDWDGRADVRKVFTDDVQMLTSVEVGKGGVWLMCPPQLLFVPDKNADDVPDAAPVVVLDGFTVAKDNYHNFANGLRWGPDGWLYGRSGHSCPGQLGAPGTPEALRVPIHGGIWRYHPERRVVEVVTHGTTNPWGHDWDENDECFFINTVTGHLWHLIPGAHLKDTSPSVNPSVYDRLDTIADHYHFDQTGLWSESRDGKANHLGGGHAHIGMMIYQADQWPASWRNKLYTINMHGRRTNVERLERKGSGYVGSHEPDVFLSDDLWFRGIEISTGPDGCGYILDWSDTGECHENTGVHRTSGRIFRVAYGEVKKPDFSDLQTLTPEGNARLLKNPNVWFRRQLQVKTELPKPDSAVLLQSANEHDRVRGIRQLTDLWPLDTIVGPLPGAVYPGDATSYSLLLQMARGDTSPLVRLSLASTLQRLPLEKRVALASALVEHSEDATDAQLPAMVWFGLMAVAERDPRALLEVAKVCKWPLTLRWISRNLAGRVETQPEPMDALLVSLSKSSEAWRIEAVISGMVEAFRGWRKAPKPAKWEDLAGSPQIPELLRDVMRELSVLFGDGRALDDVKNVVMDEKADLSARQAALRTLIDNRPPDLKELCLGVLDVRELNTTALRGLTLFDDPAIGSRLAGNYRRFQQGERSAVIETLVSRPVFAQALLKAMAAGKIPTTDLTAFHARQIRAFGDEKLTRALVETWGELRESAADKKEIIEKWTKELTPEYMAKADLSQGRMLFQSVCGVCHLMYGHGGKIGPDLTGSGRANLSYLLENIADPSGVVSAAYRMSVLTLKDGRILSGVVEESNPRTLTLRTLTEGLALERSEIVQHDVIPVSMMPEGLLQALQPEQVRDLVGYLMHPVQVPLP